MSGSGTNRLIQSENAKGNKGNSALASALKNANQEAIKILANGKKPKK